MLMFLFYGDQQDARTAQPLLSGDGKETFMGMIKHVESGCASEHPEHLIYRERGLHRASGIPVWSCARGTRNLEGACYLPVPRLLKIANVGSLLANDKLREWRFRYILKRFAETTT